MRISARPCFQFSGVSPAMVGSAPPFQRLAQIHSIGSDGAAIVAHAAALPSAASPGSMGIIHHPGIIRHWDIHGPERIADDEMGDGLLHGGLPARVGSISQLYR